MTMLPVCSATPSCSSHSQISFHGGSRSFSPFRKGFEVRCILEERAVFGLSNVHLQGVSFKTQATKFSYSNLVENIEKSVSTDFIKCHFSPNELDDLECKSSNFGAIIEPHRIGKGEIKYVESSSMPIPEEGLIDFSDQSTENANILVGPMEPETRSSVYLTPESPISVSDSLDISNDSPSNAKTSIDDLFGGVSESFSSSVNNGENVLKSTIDKINSFIASTTKSVSEAVDNAVNEVFSSVDQTGELAGNRLTNFTSDLKEATSKVAVIAVDVLRRSILAVEDSLTNGGTFVVYSYGSAKELLPPDIRDALNLSEERAVEILRPVGMAFKQVYLVVEGWEKSLGLDPNDPIVPFILFLGTSATFWVSYWVWTYSGYSGDLSPKLTLEVLTSKENAVLIDVRPEVLRERDGVPDLRRAARFRYTSVTLPEVDGSVRKLFKSGRELDDTLIAAVIRNLKIVQDRSKVIVMDADGTRSKGIARSLKKLRVEKPYLVEGGFQSWAKQGLRIKDLKPETTLSILNEEAEAILEDINPSPVQALGYGVGSIAALYALLEWEKTLQLIAIVGLALTIYQRVASYGDFEDFKKDVRLLLAPAKFGAQAFSWAAEKLETNGIGLPTSPSSLDVQNRVLQAAAKLESQPSDIAEVQGPSSEPMASVNKNVDLSEA